METEEMEIEGEPSHEHKKTKKEKKSPFSRVFFG